MYNQFPFNNYIPNQFVNNYQPKQEIIRVNGRNGAEAYQIASNSSVLLLDEQLPIVYLKQSDGAGYSTVTPYSITPYQPEPQVDVKSLEDRIKRLEDIINESHSSNDQ